MSIDIVQITDFDKNLDLLIEQYKSKDRFKGILQSANLQANDLEVAIFEVRDLFWIDTAEGTQLDVIGLIHGETRQGKNDTDYRNAIKLRIIINNGSGEPETIISTISGLYGASLVQLNNIGNANLWIWSDVPLTTAQWNYIVEIIPAGVKLFGVSGSSNPFVFFGDPDGAGFGKTGVVQVYDSFGNPMYDSFGNLVYASTGTGSGGGELQGIFISS